MGGYGTLALAKKHPELFSAIVPICGGMDDYKDIERLENMPIWLFHGDKDSTHPVERSIAIYDLLKPNNKKIKLTIYEGVGHNSWDETYANDKVYEWLLNHKKE
jgi:predicted peptidase